MPPFRRDTIKDLRQSLSMSQREFADHLGVPQTTVARWETGRTTPSAEYLGLMYDLARRHTRPFEPFAEATPATERVEIAQVAATEWLRKSKGPRGKDVVPWAETFHQMVGLIAGPRRPGGRAEGPLGERPGGPARPGAARARGGESGLGGTRTESARRR
jgi:transcriptional regulator with XRE-family HTH domain